VRIRRVRSGDQAGERLIGLFLQGDPGAVKHLEALVLQVVRFRGYYVPPQESGDLVQQVLLDVCRALGRPGFSLAQGLPAFARSVAHRRCVDWLRRHHAHDPIDPHLPDAGGRPDDKVAEAERRRLALEILSRLSGPCRDLIRMRLESRLSYGEIARTVGRSEGALRFQMHECLKHARKAAALLGGVAGPVGVKKDDTLEA